MDNWILQQSNPYPSNVRFPNKNHEILQLLKMIKTIVVQVCHDLKTYMMQETGLEAFQNISHLPFNQLSTTITEI